MTYQINVAPNGRMSLPAELRNRLGLSDGARSSSKKHLTG